MTADTDSFAVLSTKLDHVSQTVEKIERALAASAASHVSRDEWSLRNQTVDERFIDVRGDIARLEAEAQSRRAPWWSVVAVAAAIGALAWSIFGPVIIAQ